MADTDTTPNSAAAADDTGAQQFAIQKIYIKDMSFESPAAPGIFTVEQFQPQVGLDLNSQGRAIAEQTYEVVLSLTVTVKHEDKTVYLAEVQQAGIFNLLNFKPEELGQLLGSYCPNILFPYAREAVSDLVNRGGFPQLLLAPVNFDALYAQHLAEQQAKTRQAQAQQ